MFSLKSSVLQLLRGSIIGRSLSLVLNLCLSRVLGPNSLGIFSFFVSSTQTLEIASRLGVDYSITHELSGNDQNTEHQERGVVIGHALHIVETATVVLSIVLVTWLSLGANTFILLRQRFLSLLAVVWVMACILRWWFRPWLWGWLLVGLSAAYALPTALRYTRLAPAPGQPFEQYLSQSWQNFTTGLHPTNLAASALNDFSYNKAGMASLSVVLDLRRLSLLQAHDPWGWLFADLYRFLPGVLKPSFDSWGDATAERTVSLALGVGLSGWTNPGVSPELSQGWVVDLMETPFLDAVASGGWLGLLCFSLVIPILMTIVWCLACRLYARWQVLWLIPCGLLTVVGFGPSWLGDLLVLLKVVIPWIVICVGTAVLIRFNFRKYFNQQRG